MNEGILVFREEEMEETVRGLDRATVDLEDTTQTIPNMFSQMSDTGLFSGGVTKINKQISSITSSISGIETALKKHTNKMVESELKYKSKAEQIEIPRDFINTEAKEIHTIDDIYLQKKDGTSVNEGQEQKTIEELKEYTIVEENLGSIANLIEPERKEISNSTKINKAMMNNFYKTNDTMQQNLNDSTTLNKAIINNIYNTNNPEQQMYNDSSLIQKQETIYSLDANNSSMKKSSLDESMPNMIDENLLKEFEKLRW